MILARILGNDVLGAPDDNQQHWIIGDPASPTRMHLAATGEELNLSRGQQIIGGAGWLTQKPRDQNNQFFSEVLSTVRSFPSLIDCFRFRMGLAAARDEDKPHPVKGRMIVRCQEGAAFLEFRLDKALILASAAVPAGLSLALSYGIKASSAEFYRAGLSGIAIEAQAVIGGTVAEVLLPYDFDTEFGWTISVTVIEAVGDDTSYEGTLGAWPLSGAALTALTAALVSSGMDAEYTPGVGITVRSHSVGTASQVSIYITSPDPESSYIANGTNGEPGGPPVMIEDINGQALTGDFLE